MVEHELWATAVGDRSDDQGLYLCVGCLERRLGRELTAADFLGVSVNEPLDCDSPRLADRKQRA